jgi:hypothetical protein
MPGKRVQIDDETWHVLDLLARDRMATFQELADEAFADLLKKHGRPVTRRVASERRQVRRCCAVQGRQEEAAAHEALSVQP